jgi:hypothetical protein
MVGEASLRHWETAFQNDPILFTRWLHLRNTVFHVGEKEIGSEGIDKAARFERIAQHRLSETLEKLRLVGNLANKHNYIYSEDHIKQIFEAIEVAVRQARLEFWDGSSSSEHQFAFKRQQ